MDKELQESLLKQITISTDLIIRITALERLLVKKTHLTEQDIQEELIKVSEELKEVIKQARTEVAKEGESAKD